MAKDSYWFRHDSSAGRTPTMRKMTFIYGHWGKGIYWDVIEVLREQSNYTYPKDEQSMRLLCDLIGCKDEVKFMNWYRDCEGGGLFCSNKTHFWSEALSKNMKNWDAKKRNGFKRVKPKINEGDKLNESETLSESEAKDGAKSLYKDKSIEYKSTEEEKTDHDKIEEVFNKITPTSLFLTACKNAGLINPDNGGRLLRDFLTKQSFIKDSLNRDINALIEHFYNWANGLDVEKKAIPTPPKNNNFLLITNI